jgi:hypothetical protein
MAGMFDTSTSKGRSNVLAAVLVVIVIVAVMVAPIFSGASLASLIVANVTGPKTGFTGGCAYNSNGPNSGCYDTPVDIKVTLQDQYGTTSFGSSWYVRVLSGGVSPPAAQCSGPGSNTVAGAVIESSITTSGGAATTGNAYCPGQALQFEVSSGSGFTYTTTSDIYYAPIQTTPFCPSSTGCQTSTTYQPFSIVFTLNPGKNIGANANTISATFPNATTVKTTEAAYCKSGSNALGQQFALGYQVQAGTTGTLPTAPYGVGYTSFTPVDLQLSGTALRGQLITAVQFEIKETSSTGNTLNVISGPLQKLASKPAATSDVIYYVPLTDQQATLAKLSGNVYASSTAVSGDPNAGTPGVNDNGVYQFSVAFDCTQVYNGSSVTVTITAIEYMNYSPTYVASNNGGINPEAAIISASSNNVLTINT